MSGIATAVTAGVVGVAGAVAQDRAGSRAASAQNRASRDAIANEKDQFAQIQQLLAPYVEAGDKSTEAQLALLGLLGDGEQRKSILNVQNGFEYQTLLKQGEEAILQNASATGGLRGGNTQKALSEFRPQLLNQLINERFGKLGDLAGRGQAAAAGQANLQGQSSANVSQLLGSIGQANAGRAIAGGNAIASGLGAAGDAVGTFQTLKLLKSF
jgi:hypothetical protein